MTEKLTTMSELVKAFCRAMNLIDPEVENHHETVSFLASAIAYQMRMSESDRTAVFYGALLHDIGSIVQKEEDVSLFDLELNQPVKLASAGAAMLRQSHVARSLSDIVAETQSPWEKLQRAHKGICSKYYIPQIIHLADVVSLLIKDDGPVLNQIEDIRSCIHQIGTKEFNPDVLEAFDQVCGVESVWLNAKYSPYNGFDFLPGDHDVSIDEVLNLTEFMSRIIDFRSPFTAMHSAGVSAAAESLARFAGMSDDECKKMRIAGYLHDVGKLKTPKEILEKPGKLTDEEFNVIKEHAYYTYIILKDISGFEDVSLWASLHHEKLNGSGYPFHFTSGDLPLGSKIMAVADIFSAITEDRPYRKGMDKEKAIAVLRGDADRGALSVEITELMVAHFDTVNKARAKQARAASRRYQEMLMQG